MNPPRLRTDVRTAARGERLLTRRPPCAATTSEVGAGGFEPGTFWSQTRRATGLRYAPMPHNLVNAVFWCTRQFAPRCGPATPSHSQAHQRVSPAHACNTTAGTEFAQSTAGGPRMGPEER